MSGNYQDFFTDISKTGVAKTSHFQATIPTIPGSLINRFPNYTRLLALRCESAELPGRTLATQESRIYGPVYKTPYQSLYSDLTLNFIETGDLFIREFFEAWEDSVFDSTSNLLNYPNSYRTDIVLVQYDVVGSAFSTTGLLPIASWVLHEAFVSSVNPMPVTWSEDGFHRVAVTIAYTYYTMATGASRKQAGSSSPTNPITRGSASPGTPIFNV